MGHVDSAPGPVADLWEWQFEGACRDIGSESFYHPDGERGAARRLRDAAARSDRVRPINTASRDIGSEPFTPPAGARGAARRPRDAAAKEVCSGCPVMTACRDHALAIREPFGVWGGLTEDERQLLLAERDIVSAGLAG